VNNHFFGTQPVDAGRIRSETIVGDVTYGVTDRIAINLSIPVVSSKFTGDSLSPFAAPHPQPLYPGVNPLDDGRYHAELQDFHFGLRYNLVKQRGFALTPFIGSVVPSHNYEIFAHSAPGRNLNELQVGASAAKVNRVDYFVPTLGKGAEMLTGEREENIEKLLELVAAKGGLK